MEFLKDFGIANRKLGISVSVIATLNELRPGKLLSKRICPSIFR
jgi:hypothetical protein